MKKNITYGIPVQINVLNEENFKKDDITAIKDALVKFVDLKKYDVSSKENELEFLMKDNNLDKDINFEHLSTNKYCVEIVFVRPCEEVPEGSNLVTVDHISDYLKKDKS